MNAIEKLISVAFNSCQVRGDTTLELMVIEELARLMGESKRNN